MSEKRDSIIQAAKVGFIDRRLFGLLWSEQLYRAPWWNRLAWWLGWLVAYPGSTARTAGKP